jgi:uncharacterized damage-inducible protein DinB
VIRRVEMTRLIEVHDAMWDEWWRALAGLPRSKAHRVPASASAWQCLLHVVTHAHFHRGQLASQCRILGVCPPERHLMGYFIGLF